MKQCLSFAVSLLALSGCFLAAPTEESSDIVVILPECPWALRVLAPGFVVQNLSVSPDGEEFSLMAANRKRTSRIRTSRISSNSWIRS